MDDAQQLENLKSTVDVMTCLLIDMVQHGITFRYSWRECVMCGSMAASGERIKHRHDCPLGRAERWLAGER